MRYSHHGAVTSFVALALVSFVILAGAPPSNARTGVPATAHAFSSHVRPRLAAGSPKPDWRGTDLGNSGDEAVNGPATTPTQVFNANPGAGNGVTQGIEFDGAGNVLFTKGDGFVYSYNPTTQAQNWVASAGSSTFGGDTTGAASAPVASADGNVYIIDDTGHLDKINAASGASTQILTYGADVAQTLKVDDATGKLFFGGQDHFINSYTKAGTNTYSVAATGSTQDGTLTGCAGAVSGGPRFYGEGALDSGDNFYVASLEPKTTGPRSCANTTFGTLYKVSPTGTILAAKPLAGATVGAVTLVPNAAVAGGSEVVVGTKLGYAEAFDSALNRLWATKVGTNFLNASPVVDAARNRVYVADNGSSLYALNLTTGAVDTAFTAFNATGAMTGTVALNGGTQSSPILDAGGNVYAVDSAGTLFKFDPTGATVWSVPTTIGTGFFGVAIANDGTVYTGGNLGQVSGFNAATGATSTNTPADTATITSADTATSTATAATTATNTAVAGATVTNTAVVSATITSTAVATNTATATSPVGTATATNTAVVGATATNTPLAGGATSTTPAGATATNTAAPPSNTPIPSTATNTPTSTPTSTATPTGTATPATGTPGPTGTPTLSPGQALGWSKNRADLHNDGDSTLKLDLSQPPGALFTDKLSSDPVGGFISSSPVIGPSPDGNANTYRIYQIDDAGRLNAVRPDGSVAWTSGPVLGSYHNPPIPVGGQAGSVPFENYRVGGPAVSADGAIYAGSAANYGSGDSGVWRFDPQTGAPTKFFGAGNYLGSSPAIGPAGAVYIGSIEGTVYAINKDGSQRYAYAVSAGGDCPGGLSPLVQSSPVLDKAGNLYVGYGCAGPTPLQGGVLALSPTGSELWHYRHTIGTGRQAVPGKEVLNAVVLAPDEQTVYAEEGLVGSVLALNAGNGSLKWTFGGAYGGNLPGTTGVATPSLGNIALSPDGSLLYVPTVVQAPEGIAALYALHAADGSVAAAGQQSSQNPNPLNLSPAVDGNGNVLVGLDNGEVLAYGPNLGAPLFDYNESGTATYLNGPAIGPDGSIFLTDNLGNLRALKQGLILPPPPPPTSTAVPTATQPPDPTLTPYPTIASGSACPGVATATDTSTPVATATYTPGGDATATAAPTSTPCPTATATTTASSAQQTAIAKGTASSGSHGGNGGTPTPTSHGPTATATPITVQGNGYKLAFSGGVLTPGNLSRVRVDTTPQARVSYTLQVSYDYPTATPRSSTSGHKSTKKSEPPTNKVHAVAKRGGAGTHLHPIVSQGVAPQPGGDQPSGALRGDLAAAKATATPRAGARAATPRPGAKATATPRATAKPSTAATSKPATCYIAATIRDRVTFHLARTADRHGVDQYCVRVATVPARAVDLRIVMTVQVASGKKTFKPSTFTFLVRRPVIVPVVQSRLILPEPPKLIGASLDHSTVATNATQTVRSFTARYTHVTYRVAYPSGPARIIAAVADRNGNNAVSFRVSYLPPRSTGARATVTILSTQQIGRTTRRGRPYVLSFTVLRPAVVRSRTVLPATIDAAVGHGAINTNATQTVSSFTARYAHVIYRVVYLGSQSRTISAVADRNGNNTVSFRVSYLPLRSVGMARAIVTIVATQGTGRTTRRARPYALSFTVQRPDARLSLRDVSVRLGSGTTRPNGVERVDTVSARDAALSYVVVYGTHGVEARYSGHADGSGYATLRFHVEFAPPPGKRMRAVLTVTAVQGRAHASSSARFYVQG